MICRWNLGDDARGDGTGGVGVCLDVLEHKHSLAFSLFTF